MNIVDKKNFVAVGTSAEESQRSQSRKIHLSLDRLSAQGIITPQAAKSKTSEEYRLIKLPLLRNAFAKGAAAVDRGNLIMVTSSQPGEGKTFTSINLAISISMEMDKKVLLVDADVARPSVARYLGIEATEGLVDVLLNPSLDLAQCMLRTNIPNLTILTSGTSFPRSTELLASQAMSDMVEEFSTRYPDRIVIFDTAPLLASSEAAVMANLAGQIVMVVEAERTQRHVLAEALGLLDQNKIIGMVLNKSRSPKGTDYYGTYSYN